MGNCQRGAGQPRTAGYDDRRRPWMRTVLAVRSDAIFRTVAADSGCPDRFGVLLALRSDRIVDRGHSVRADRGVRIALDACAHGLASIVGSWCLADRISRSGTRASGHVDLA